MNHDACTLWHQEYGEHGGVCEEDCDGGWQQSNDGEDRCEIETGDSQLVQKHVQRLHPPNNARISCYQSSCWFVLTLLLGLWQLVLLYEPLLRSCNMTSVLLNNWQLYRMLICEMWFPPDLIFLALHSSVWPLTCTPEACCQSGRGFPQSLRGQSSPPLLLSKQSEVILLPFFWSQQ